MARRGGYMGGMPGNMNNLMKQAQRMQRQLEENKKKLEETDFTVTSGGGAVTGTVSGKKEIKDLQIKPEVCDPDDVEMLQDMIIVAVHKVIHSDFPLFLFVPLRDRYDRLRCLACANLD